jgi:hypothetical protein
MIINDFNVMGIMVSPDKTYPPLDIDSDRILPVSVTAQTFQMIRRRCPQVREFRGSIQLSQPALCPRHNVGRKSFDMLSRPQRRNSFVLDSSDQFNVSY